MPQWYRQIKACKILNCSLFDLLSAPDAGLWIDRALIVEQADNLTKHALSKNQIPDSDDDDD